MTADPYARLDATIALQPRSWGTEIDLTCPTGPPSSPWGCPRFFRTADR
jgi:hypothetical protein